MNALEIPDIDLNKELSKCKSMEDLVVKNGLMRQLFVNIIHRRMK
jgi:putative transposase